MLVSETYKVLVEKDELKEIVCNKCGNSVICDNSTLSHIAQSDYHTITISGSYGSTYPRDLEIISFELCSNCLQQLTSSFKVAPSLKNVDVVA